MHGDGLEGRRQRGAPKRTHEEVKRIAEAVGSANPHYSMERKFKIANATITRKRVGGRRGR